MLPGSRIGEIERLLDIFGRTVELVGKAMGRPVLVIPAVPHLVGSIAAMTKHWAIRPRIVAERADKRAAFRIARAALAKSGTVTLELALSGVPMAAAYRVSWLEAVVARRMLTIRSVTLPNLVLGENVVPELLQEACTAENLAAALIPLLQDTPERHRQCQAFGRLDSVMGIGSIQPAVRAADIVLNAARRRLADVRPGSN
jgi:lipid-A-disaccharide synthase